MSLLSFVTTCYFLLCDNDNEDDNEYDNEDVYHINMRYSYCE